MPIDANFLGGVAQGATQARQIQADHAFRKAQNDLERKKLKMAEEEHNLKLQMTQRQMDGFLELIKGSVAPPKPTAPTGSVAPSGLNMGTPQGPPIQPPFRPGVQPPSQAPAQTGQQNTPQFTPEQLKNAQILASMGDYEGATKALITKPDTPSVGTDREALSGSMFFKPWSDLTQDQRKAVMARETEIKSERSRQQGAGSAAAKLDQPLSPEERGNLIDVDFFLETGQFKVPPAGLTGRQANTGNFSHVPPKERVELASLKQAEVIIDTSLGLADKLITAETAGEAASQFFNLKLGELLRTNPGAAAYMDSLQGALGVVSRTLGGERGVLTDRDISRIARWFPSFRDTKKVREFKAATLRNLLITAQQEKANALVGRPTDPKKFRQRIENVFKTLEEGAEQRGGQPPTVEEGNLMLKNVVGSGGKPIEADPLIGFADKPPVFKNGVFIQPAIDVLNERNQ